jgi:predicted negative regulator of RcsB-dependent stress response
MKRSQNGFAHLALVLLVLVMAVIAFAGYKVVKDRQDKTAANTTSTAITNTSETINTKADLDKAVNTLNNESVDSTLDPDSLNNDVTSLL